MKKEIKLRVTPEQSRRIQEICFTYDIGWLFVGDSYEVRYCDASCLYISEKSLSFCDTYANFDALPYQEVSADLFIRTNGTCQEYSQEISKFKEYGFREPVFECKIYDKIDNKFFGAVLDQVREVWEPVTWDLNGISDYDNFFNLDQVESIQKLWHLTCEFPILIWNISKDRYEIATALVNQDTLELTSGNIDASDVLPLTNAEIDNLKRGF
jgi:hypothetical protein